MRLLLRLRLGPLGLFLILASSNGLAQRVIDTVATIRVQVPTSRTEPSAVVLVRRSFMTNRPDHSTSTGRSSFRPANAARVLIVAHVYSNNSNEKE
jgi:hypothetical protein